MELLRFGQDTEFHVDHSPPHFTAKALAAHDCIGSRVGRHKELLDISDCQASTKLKE